MRAAKDPWLLFAYRTVSAGLGVAAPLYLYWRGKTGRDDDLRRHERLGRPYLDRPSGPLALLQAGSRAESAECAPLIEKLVRLGFGVLVTVREPDPRFSHAPRHSAVLYQLAPLDTPQSVKRFLGHWRPDAVLQCGGEFPPILICEAHCRKIPLALVNARPSALWFLVWRRFPTLAASLLRRFDVCLAQTDAGAGRLKALGARSVRVTGSLKYDVAPAPADQTALARLAAKIGTRPVWVAGGIALAEAKTVLAAHGRLKRPFPDVLTVIVPQSPKHVFEIADAAARMGFLAAIRGADPEAAPFPEIYIARAADEAGLFYRAAGAVFAGRSLSDGDGKNPVQAARLGCAILHGPEIDDFEDFFAALDRSGGGMLVFDAETLAKQLALLFFDKGELRAASRAAAGTAEAFGGASARIIDALAPYLAQALVAQSGGEG